MFEHNPPADDAVYFSRFDEDSPFSTVSTHPFQLEDYVWPTAEHYYQAHKFEGLPYAQTILTATTGRAAHRLGNRLFKRKINHWKNNRRLWMTRALYRKAAEYGEVREALLATGTARLVETSLYDHFWGTGRDQRGDNMLGKVWMDIRRKLNQSATAG